jgi:hypothetical protein
MKESFSQVNAKVRGKQYGILLFKPLCFVLNLAPLD